MPCVIVLDILAGNQKLPEAICQHLAQSGIGGLFVQMPYYGPRRPTEQSVRFISNNMIHTIEAVRQTVLDLCPATAWMESRPGDGPATARHHGRQPGQLHGGPGRRDGAKLGPGGER